MEPKEDLFGTRKRLLVFREWIDGHRQSLGGGPLEILDYGCGTGLALTAPLADSGDRIHGVDPHQGTIALARERNRRPNLTFSTESAESLLSVGGRYDVAICSEVLEHLEDPEACLRALHGLLRPRGLLLVTVPNGFGSFERLNRLERFLERAGVGWTIDRLAWLVHALHWRLAGRGVPPRPGEKRVVLDRPAFLDLDSVHVQFFRLNRLEGVFRATGFAIEEERGRVLVCGPYVGFWASLLSFGGWIYRVNNWLADRLPLSWAADWMFRLRAVGRSDPP